MFHKFALLFALAAVGLCAEPEVIPIVSQTNDASPDGSFQWAFESGDHITQQQAGEIVNVDKDHAVESVHGSVSYVDPEGNKHETNYVADQNGYQPQSADIPVPPPVPAYVMRALEYQAAHPEPVEPVKA